MGSIDLGSCSRGGTTEEREWARSRVVVWVHHCREGRGEKRVIPNEKEWATVVRIVLNRPGTLHRRD